MKWSITVKKMSESGTYVGFTNTIPTANWGVIKTLSWTETQNQCILIFFICLLHIYFYMKVHMMSTCNSMCILIVNRAVNPYLLYKIYIVAILKFGYYDLTVLTRGQQYLSTLHLNSTQVKMVCLDGIL